MKTFILLIFVALATSLVRSKAIVSESDVYSNCTSLAVKKQKKLSALGEPCNVGCSATCRSALLVGEKELGCCSATVVDELKRLQKTFRKCNLTPPSP